MDLMFTPPSLKRVHVKSHLQKARTDVQRSKAEFNKLWTDLLVRMCLGDGEMHGSIILRLLGYSQALRKEGARFLEPLRVENNTEQCTSSLEYIFSNLTNVLYTPLTMNCAG